MSGDEKQLRKVVKGVLLEGPTDYDLGDEMSTAEESMDDAATALAGIPVLIQKCDNFKVAAIKDLLMTADILEKVSGASFVSDIRELADELEKLREEGRAYAAKVEQVREQADVYYDEVESLYLDVMDEY